MMSPRFGSAVGVFVLFAAGMAWAGQVNVINPASSAGGLGRVVVVVPSASTPVTSSVSAPVSSAVTPSVGSSVSSATSVSTGAETVDLSTGAKVSSGLSARHQVVSVALSNTALTSVATPELRIALLKIESTLGSSRVSPSLRARLEAEVQRINTELGGR